MNKRLVALVGKTTDAPRVSHYWGMPPELSDGLDTRKKLPHPAILVIEEEADGVSLFRFTADGSCVGDTWHMNIDDAQHQAKYEYDKTIEEWKEVPPEISDVVMFALKQTS